MCLYGTCRGRVCGLSALGSRKKLVELSKRRHAEREQRENDEREQAHAEHKRTLEARIDALINKNDAVELLIGGRRFVSSIAVLSKYPDSLLGM